MSDRGRSPAPSGGGGPRGPSPRGLSGSRPSSPARSAAGSQGQAQQPAPGGWAAAMGFDPAKPAKKQDKGNTRMELPADAYVADTQKSMFALRGNKLNTEGKPAMIDVNQYRMVNFNFKKTIHQYDPTSVSGP